MEESLPPKENVEGSSPSGNIEVLVAQMEEHLATNQEVESSSLSRDVIYANVPRQAIRFPTPDEESSILSAYVLQNN